MFIDIIPSEHSIGTSPLTYSIPEDLINDIIPGCLVEIPIKHNQEYGVVVGFRQITSENMEIRDISQIVTSKEVLAPYQIALILEISMRYLIPIHRVLGFFLTKNIIKRLSKKNFESIKKTNTYGYHDDQKKYFTILQNGITTGALLEQYLIPGTVILCPDDFTLLRLQNELGGRESILFIANESTETKKAQSWIDIQNKKYDIIVGNRKILYYNLSSYNTIIYLEDAFGREYFHYPIKIDYIDILEALEKQKKFNIRILTSVPRLTTLSQFRHFSIEYL